MVFEAFFWLYISSVHPSDPLHFFPGCKPLPAVEDGQKIEPLKAQPPREWNKPHIIRA